MTSASRKRPRAGGAPRGNGRAVPERMKLSLARKYLKEVGGISVSATKMRELVRSQVLEVESDPLDGRVKLVKVEDLDKLVSGRRANGASLRDGGAAR
jgi:hypothetical protein